jgi:hypothetical protein
MLAASLVVLIGSLAALQTAEAQTATAQAAPAAAPASAARVWTTADPEGQRGQFQFLGQRIGDPITKAFPDYKTAKDQFGGPICQLTVALPGFIDCAHQDLRRMVDGIPRLDYSGVEVKFVNMRYIDGKLVGFTMGFDSKNYEPLAAVLQRQFGAPFSTEHALWKDRLGLQYNTAIQTWNTPHGLMEFKERWVSPENGMLALMETAAERRYQAVRFKDIVVE